VLDRLCHGSDAAEEPAIENGRITEVAGPRADRLADAAAALFAGRGDSVEIREVREPGDPDAEAMRRRRAAQPGREARRSQLRRLARGGVGEIPAEVDAA